VRWVPNPASLHRLISTPPHLLSPMDHAPPIGRVVEGIEQRIVVQAGQGADLSRPWCRRSSTVTWRWKDAAW
jgi:hypothetical protein